MSAIVFNFNVWICAHDVISAINSNSHRETNMVWEAGEGLLTCRRLVHKDVSLRIYLNTDNNKKHASDAS